MTTDADKSIIRLMAHVDYVIEELLLYDGGMICGKSHLFIAVSQLERVCQQTGGLDSGGAHYSLPYPANNIWLHLLDVSNGLPMGISTLIPDGRLLDFDMKEILPKPRKKRAKVLAVMLAVSLRGCHTMAELCFQTECKLPYIPDCFKNDS